MSSIILNHHHYNTVLAALEDQNSRSAKPVFFYSVFKNGTPEMLVTELRKLNVICYFLQYRRHYENIDVEIERGMKEIFKPSHPAALSLYGLHSALSCIQYQIEIWHLEELRELTRLEAWAMDALDNLISGIANHVIDQHPAYPDTWEIRQNSNL